jgi:hypothetical protein
MDLKFLEGFLYKNVATLNYRYLNRLRFTAAGRFNLLFL